MNGRSPNRPSPAPNGRSWLGSPTFWRLYVGTLLVMAAVMRATGWELPHSVSQVGLQTVVGILSWDLGRQTIQLRRARAGRR